MGSHTSLLPILALGLCSACAPQPVAEVSIHDQRQQALNRIADQCRLARATFELIGDDELHVKPEPTARYQSVDCALQKLKESKLPVKMGFVGNEIYAPELN